MEKLVRISFAELSFMTKFSLTKLLCESRVGVLIPPSNTGREGWLSVHLSVGLYKKELDLSADRLLRISAGLCVISIACQIPNVLLNSAICTRIHFCEMKEDNMKSVPANGRVVIRTLYIERNKSKCN